VSFPRRPRLTFLRSVIISSETTLRYLIYFTASKEAVRIDRILHGSREITSANFLFDELDPLG